MTLSYNGATYRLAPDELARLVEHGVIVPDPMLPGAYELAPDHLIDGIGGDTIVVSRQTGADATGEGTDEGRRRLIAVRYMHRDGEGAR